eukprot:5374888-Pleurochrysis_carterae.AAC.4
MAFFARVRLSCCAVHSIAPNKGGASAQQWRVAILPLRLHRARSAEGVRACSLKCIEPLARRPAQGRAAPRHRSRDSGASAACGRTQQKRAAVERVKTHRAALVRVQ